MSSKAKKVLIRTSIILGSIIIFLTIICVVIYCIQPLLFFYPNFSSATYAMLKDDDTYEEVEIDGEYGKLSGWFKYNVEKEEVAPLVIFFYGNAQDSSSAINSFNYEYSQGYNMLVVDYPGYGLSDGSPSEESIFSMALSTYDYAITLDNVDLDNIIVMGYSIGTGPATYLASKRDVNGLILISPYDEGLSLYNTYFPIFYGPLKLLVRYKLESKVYAQSVDVSPLIVTSVSDETIPYELSKNLVQYFNKAPTYIELTDGTSHNGYFYNEIVLNAVADYLDERL